MAFERPIHKMINEILHPEEKNTFTKEVSVNNQSCGN